MEPSGLPHCWRLSTPRQPVHTFPDGAVRSADESKTMEIDGVRNPTRQGRRESIQATSARRPKARNAYRCTNGTVDFPHLIMRAKSAASRKLAARHRSARRCFRRRPRSASCRRFRSSSTRSTHSTAFRPDASCCWKRLGSWPDARAGLCELNRAQALKGYPDGAGQALAAGRTRGKSRFVRHLLLQLFDRLETGRGPR